jgi:LEA14-like dessication related protein
MTKSLSILLVSVLLLCSCAGWKDVELSNIEAIRLGKADKAGMTAEIDVKINNPNKFGFRVYKSDLQVKLNNNPVGNAHIQKNIWIKANTDKVYTITICGNLDNFLSASGGLMGLIGMATSKKANIGISGNLKAGRFLYRKKIPIDRKEDVPLFK